MIDPVFKDIELLIVGDLMIDRYLWGAVSRISPEAPVPVVNINRNTTTLGGAANVAANAAALGARVKLVGLVGNDQNANELGKLLEEQNIASEYLVRSNTRPTTTKTRIVGNHQHIVRLDEESNTALDKDEISILKGKFDERLAKADIVILSDYAKGIFTEDFARFAIEKCRAAGKPVFVDPKGKNYFKYSNATLITPNRREAFEATRLDEHRDDVADAGKHLLEDLKTDAVLITQGEDGMTLFRSDAASTHFPTVARDVYDVTGAGDTVISTAAVAYASGYSLEQSAEIANRAAGIVVEQVGTTVITLEKLRTHQ